MDHDARVKKAQFIQKSTEVRETFSFADPVEILSAVKVYTCDFYGAMLWDILGYTTDKLYKSRNTCIKLVWTVPQATHTFFLDHLLCVGFSYVRTDLIARLCIFFKGMLRSACTEVRILANIVGVQTDVPVRDQWRQAFLAKLLMGTGENMYQGDEVEELTELIDSLCVGECCL
jgi:hypothetical protein